MIPPRHNVRVSPILSASQMATVARTRDTLPTAELQERFINRVACKLRISRDETGFVTDSKLAEIVSHAYADARWPT